MAARQQIAFTVLVNGAEIPYVTAVSSAASMEQQVSTCTFTVTERPKTAEIGDDVQVYASSGGAAELIFRGLLFGHGWETSAGTLVQIPCVGILDRLRRKWGGPDRAYLNQDDAAVIRNLIEARGIPSSRHHIESSGWTLATIQTLIAAKGKPFLPIINEIDLVAGYKTFDDLDGAIYRLRYGALPGDPTAYLQYGQDGLRISRSRKPDNIRNHWLVKGFTYQGVPVQGEFQAVNVTLDALVEPQFRPHLNDDTLSSDLIETNPKAQSVAERCVSDFNKTDQSFDITLTPNGTRFRLGQNIAIQYPPLEAGATVICQSIKHELTPNSWVIGLRTDGGTLATPGA